MLGVGSCGNYECEGKRVTIEIIIIVTIFEHSTGFRHWHASCRRNVTSPPMTLTKWGAVVDKGPSV